MYPVIEMEVGKITELRERGSRIWINRGIEHLDVEAYEAALEAFKRAYELDPQSPQAVQYLAQELYFQGKPAEAERLLKDAIDVSSDVLLYRTLCAIVLEDSSRRDEALEIIKKVRNVCGDEKTAVILEAHYEIENNNGARALYLFQSILDSDPKNQEASEGVARALNLIGIDLSESGKNEEAIFTFKRAIEFDPLWSAPQVNLGNCYCNIGDTERARSAYLHGIELEPDNPQAHFNIARLYADEENYDAAESELLEILDIEPAYPDIHFELGRIYSLQGRFAESVEQYEMELKANPDCIPCLCNLAIAYINGGLVDEGEKTLKKALGIEEDPFTLYTLAGLYATMDRESDSITLLERAAGFKPTWLVDYLRTDEKFDRLRENPRFNAVLLTLAQDAS